MSSRTLALSAAVLVLAAACTDGPTGSPAPVPASIRMAADSGTVRMGQTAGLSTTVLDAQGQTIDGARVRYTSIRPEVAAVDSVTGAITPVAVGIAEIEVLAQPVRTTVRVVVVPAGGATVVQFSLDYPRPVMLETGSLVPQAIRFYAANAAGEKLCGVVPLALIFDPAVFVAQAARAGDPCVITLVPQAEGAGWLRAVSGGKRDSVWTVVHHTRYHWAFDLPRVRVAAGTTSELQFVVWGEDGKPVSGVSVDFGYGPAGSMTHTTVVTGPDGVARTTWMLPQSTLRTGTGPNPLAGDTTLPYAFSATTSIGLADSSRATLQPGLPHHIEVLVHTAEHDSTCTWAFGCFRRKNSSTYTKLESDSAVLHSTSHNVPVLGTDPFCNDPTYVGPCPQFPVGFHTDGHFETLVAVVVDRFGNPTSTVPTLTGDGSSAAVAEVRGVFGGTFIPCCTWFHSVGGRALVTNLTRAFEPVTVTFTSPGLPSRTVTASGTMN